MCACIIACENGAPFRVYSSLPPCVSGVVSESNKWDQMFPEDKRLYEAICSFSLS